MAAGASGALAGFAVSNDAVRPNLRVILSDVLRQPLEKFICRAGIFVIIIKANANTAAINLPVAGVPADLIIF